MGKAEIISYLGSGQYSVKIVYGGRDRINLRISNLNDRISDLQAKYDEESDPYTKSILNLQIKALEKDVEYLERGMPDDPIIDVFCADLTEDLSGYIGIIEIPGEDQAINIQPGYESNAVYSQSRDGQLFPAIACSADQAFFNKAILPGWQKWKPTYRFGRIISIDKATDTCQVNVLPAHSSQQNLNVNQGEGSKLGDSETEYQYTSRTHQGWEDFKSTYSTHPFVISTDSPQALVSTDDLVKQIWDINLEVNSKHLYESDSSYRKTADDWRIMSGDDENALANERGDCEDFALTKMDKLIKDLGLSPKNMQLGLCYTNNGDYHANLLVPTTKHGVLVLDINLFGQPTKSKLDNIGYYYWDLFILNGSQNAEDIRSFFTIPISYMGCNSAAFDIGDEVIIRFNGQNWNDAEVIGFRNNPQECGTYFCQIFGWSGVQFRTHMVNKTWEYIPNAAHDPHRSDVGCAAIGAGVLCVGGWWSDPIKKYNTVDLLSGLAFSAKEDIPGDARGSISVFESGGKAYAVGGSDYYTGSGVGWSKRYKGTYEYDPESDSWSAKSNAPEEIDALSGHNIGDIGYVFGGGYFIETLCQDFGQYFIQAQSWIGAYSALLDAWGNRNPPTYEQFSRMQFTANNLAFILGAACYPDHPGAINPIYDCGGDSFEWAVTQKLQAYDPSVDSWSIRADMLDFEAPSQYPGTYSPMSATAAQITRGAASQFEEKGYIHTRTINGTGLIEWDPITETWSLFSDQEPYEPCATCGSGQYSSGCVA